MPRKPKETPPKPSRSWAVYLIRKKGDFLGTVQAPDREAAEQAAIERFLLTDLQRKRLVLTETPEMPSEGTLGYLVGKLDVLRVVCPACDRYGRYHVARLVEEFGAAYLLTDLLSGFTADCPQKAPGGPPRVCDAVMPDLSGLP